MDTFYAFLLALIVFYILMEWRLGKARREAEKRYADLEAKTRWLYKMLDELQSAPPRAAEAPAAEAHPAAKAIPEPQAESIAVPQRLTFHALRRPAPVRARRRRAAPAPRGSCGWR